MKLRERWFVRQRVEEERYFVRWRGASCYWEFVFDIKVRRKRQLVEV
jgi:hypothetical protein